MELFHASKISYQIGDIVNASATPSYYYPNATNLMDSMRPSGFPARSSARYSSDSEELCVYYLITQGVPESEIKLYRVRVNDYCKSPFAITHVVEKRIAQNIPVNNLIYEYWNPTKQWKNYEYLSTTFEILEILCVRSPNSIILCHTTGQDNTLANSIS